MTDLDAVTAAAAAGDARALETIYRALAPVVRGYLAVRGSRDPDGMTNEVFLQVVPRIRAVHGGWEGLRTLTFSVAHARLVDEHRQRARRPDTTAYEQGADGRTAPSAEQSALERVAAGELAEVLELLPDQQREVIVLRVLADLSVRQTAETLGLSEPAVKKMQAKGLAALRALLSPLALVDDRQQGR
ncbi:sigma-70 family RNA polymerase sigma factor [Phycicoccus sp. HDW14]|uniref:RNA polymerase sigma factor n=1 Tax=Phycicoccus sp. HDW14 TaxID=2714941 RepID=UPI001408A3B1|nr:sigma-70 family RNA polymerase sigma factor [Phycicoccus sp. HDW14]QIM21798.1 sigma-70 family RNA polymerase sigma factor [Phycicoccus sp. HDW14]